MRVIAGKYRRRKLKSNPGKTTRPITDQAKEMLFERLHKDIENKRIADIFAGTGTIGLEALSRGAKSVVFMERDRKAFQLLRENVATLEVEEETMCWCVDVLRTSFSPNRVPEMLPFETIFFDPPYEMVKDILPGSGLYKSLERLARVNVSSANALLVLRTPEKAVFELPPNWQKDRELKWGSMRFHLFENSITADEDQSNLPSPNRTPDPVQEPSESGSPD